MMSTFITFTNALEEALFVKTTLDCVYIKHPLSAGMNESEKPKQKCTSVSQVVMD